jgi:hypothetical protein
VGDAWATCGGRGGTWLMPDRVASWHATRIGVAVGTPAVVGTAACSGVLARGGVWPAGRADSKSGFTIHAGQHCL